MSDLKVHRFHTPNSEKLENGCEWIVKMDSKMKDKEPEIKVKVISFNISSVPKETEEMESQFWDTTLNENADVICIQGIWDSKMRHRIEEILASSYPYCVKKSDAQGFRVGLCKSGLLIASRFPIQKVKFENFLENFITKGIIGVQILIRPNTPFWVFTTHLHSDFFQFSNDLRTKQLGMIKDFLNASCGQSPALLCGDLNMSGSVERSTAEYANLMQILGGKNVNITLHKTPENYNSPWLEFSSPYSGKKRKIIGINEHFDFALAFNMETPLSEVICSNWGKS